MNDTDSDSESLNQTIETRDALDKPPQTIHPFASMGAVIGIGAALGIVYGALTDNLVLGSVHTQSSPSHHVATPASKRP